LYNIVYEFLNIYSILSEKEVGFRKDLSMDMDTALQWKSFVLLTITLIIAA
jgi:hypothetical protein